ncbi:MAG TPA: GntR family transcriptional regulator [Solirubrobacteraceae bacterium]|nr:GntR family transcriptional regulator [Solirubrobacteraceae bacterium]
MSASPDIIASPRTVAGLVAERLRAQIVAGELLSGTKLRQVELARRFGVSTTPVREALAALQREGLVRLHPQRGAVVFVPTVQDLREHYEIRAALEALAAACTAERFQERWAGPLCTLLEEMQTGPEARRYLELNQRFHTELYAHCDRERLVEMIAGLRDASSAYLHIYRAAADFPAARLDVEHRRILAACVARDAEEAATATREHLQNTVEHVASRLEQPA